MVGQLVIGASEGIVFLKRHLDSEIVSEHDTGLRATRGNDISNDAADPLVVF